MASSSSRSTSAAIAGAVRGLVREMDPGGFFTHAAYIPGMAEDIDSDGDPVTDSAEISLINNDFSPFKFDDELRDAHVADHQALFRRVTLDVGATEINEEMKIAAVEAIVRIEGTDDLTREILDANGMEQFFPIAKGEVQEMRQYIHYHLKDGKIESVGCALV